LPNLSGIVPQVLAQLNAAGLRSAGAAVCLGSVLGGCGALSVDTRSGAVYGMLVLGVGLAHAQDAQRRGQSLVPVALGVVLGAAVLLGTLSHLTAGGGGELATRQARLWRWLGPAAAVIAALRLLAWLVAR
jgi:hypothetical protein